MRLDEILTTAKDAITVKRIFGDPYQHDGLTIIPAAAVTGGLGGGTGTDNDGQEGEGGGFAMAGRPVGAYVIKDGEVTWKPVLDPTRILTVVGAVCVAYLLTRRPRRRT